MENSLTKLLESEQKTGTVIIKILKKGNTNDCYIVADQSSYAILDLTSKPYYSNYIELEKTYKIIKCIVEHDKLIPSNFKPIICKSQITVQANKKKLHEIAKKLEGPSTSKLIQKVNLQHLEENAKDNTYISNLSVIIATVSRPIETQRGTYKIATIIDENSNKANLNLYDKHADQVESGIVYSMHKIKKITIQTNGEGKMRLCANKFSVITQITDQNQIDSFENIMIGDAKVNGTLEAIIDLSFYESCKKHFFKVDEDGNCRACTGIAVQTKPDFTGKIYITSDTDDLEVQFFKRQMGSIVGETDDQEKIGDKLNDLVDKMVSIEYKKNNEEQNILVKIKLN